MMNYVKNFNFFGVDAKEIPSIVGEGAPTTATIGAVGCFYMNELDGKVYKCTAVNDGVYAWEELGAGGDSCDCEDKLDKQQGVENIGKILVVDEDGNLKIADSIFDETLLPSKGGKNLFDKNALGYGAWYYNGQIQYNESAKNFCYTDYIPVEGGSKYVYSGNKYAWETLSNLHSYAYLDASKTFISSTIVTSDAEYHILDIPKGVSYVIINSSDKDRTLAANVQFEKGDYPTEYEEYIPSTEDTAFYLPKLKIKSAQVEDLPAAITEQYDEEDEGKILVINEGGHLGLPSSVFDYDLLPSKGSKNLINLATVTKGSFYNPGTGREEFYPDNIYAENFVHTEFIPVEGGETYVYSGNAYIGDSATNQKLCYMYSYAYFDESKNYVSGATVVTWAEYHIFEIPQNVSYIVINDNKYDRLTGGKAQFEKGEYPTEYEEYKKGTEDTAFYLPKLKIKKAQIDDETSVSKNEVSLQLPEEYSLVVGDTFELFFRGIINAVNTDLYYVEIDCAIGQAFTKRYICTPTAENVGNYNMKVSLYDPAHNLLDEKTVVLSVKNKATSPSEEVVVLYVGDSLASGGHVPNEFKRRLVKTDGAPLGDGLQNVSFIGTCQSADGEVDYEGYGGYKFDTYITEGKGNSFMWITADGHDKTNADQHSIYIASNSTRWKLETIEDTRIKLVRVDSGSLPVSGTLTWQSGGANHSNIVYTDSEQAAGNPFWDETLGSNNFVAYAQKLGKTKIDYIYVLLGWNSAYDTESVYRGKVKQFIDDVLGDFPDCKIVLLGLQVPARDGLGYNYGATGVYSRYYDMMQYVFTLNALYTDLANEYRDNVSFVNIAGQFDTEHNMLTAERPVNARNTETETFQNNGVHPAKVGSKQIADACYRDFVHKLQS